jgi:phage terminase large subunit
VPEITLPFNYVPRNYQLPVWGYMQGPEEGKRACCIWHRRAGKDLFAINLIGCKAHERIGTYWHLLPTYKQGRNIVWNGFTRDGRKFLDHFPKELVAGENATEMRVTFKNQSIYQVVGTDNIDSLVGTNPIGCVFSEYSLQDPGAWDYIRPILAENGGWALFIYTARGKNHGFDMLNMARRNPKWFCEVLTAGSGESDTKRPDGTPVISDEIIQEERDSGMPEEMIQQEYKCSFDAPLVGSYYGPQMMVADNEKRIGIVPVDPLLEVDTAWDLGIGDSMSIWFFQQYGMEVRVVDYYENSGEGLGHYIRELKEKQYNYGKHYAPHDIQVRELTSGLARIDAAREMGLRFTVVPKHDVNDGIEATRNLLPLCWFDAERCKRGIEALRGYRKEWNEKMKCYSANPLHDWTSHGADAFRIFAMGGKVESRKKKQKRQETAVDEHSYL